MPIEKVFEKLYTLDSKNKVRVFECEVAVNSAGGIGVVTRTGLLGGKLLSKLSMIREGKNQGKANETTPLTQALLKADSLWREKWDEGYKSSRALTEYNDKNPSGYQVLKGDPTEERWVRLMLKEYPIAAQTNIDWEYLPMLAIKFKDLKQLTFPYLCQPKLNGVRCMARYDKEKQIVKLVSRGGTYYQIPHIGYSLDILYRKLAEEGYENFLLDGEIYKHGMNLQDISGAARTEESGMFASNSWLEYHIYDVVNLNNLNETEELRWINRISIGTMVSTHNLNCIKIVKTRKILDKTEIQENHDEYLEEGYEGAILRVPSAKYEFNQRSKGLIKVKSFQDEEFEIVGCEAEPDNIGESFVFVLRNNINPLTFKARPTGKLSQKEIWYENIEEYKGDKVTVRFQERSKDGLPIQGHVRSELTEVLHIRPDGE